MPTKKVKQHKTTALKVVVYFNVILIKEPAAEEVLNTALIGPDGLLDEMRDANAGPYK